MNFRMTNLSSALAAIGLALAATSVGATPDAMLAQASTNNSTTPPPATTGTPATTAVPSSSSAASSNGASSASSTTGGNANAAADAEARKVFDELDTNHDGTLSFDEFKRATIRPK
jgi:hypothetical protein